MADFRSAFGSWFETTVGDINRRAFRALEETVKDGEELTQTFIATRGTEGTGKQGRIETGEMLDSVTSEANLLNSEEAEGRFGWLDKSPYYAKYQEAGTKTIAPMYALSDAGEIVIQELRAKLDDAIRGA